MRGKGWSAVLKKLMAMWLRECIRRMPRGSDAAVRKNLLRPVRQVLAADAAPVSGRGGKISKRAAQNAQFQNEYRNTMVALAVAKYNYFGARDAKTPADYYRKVNRYFQRALSSTRAHLASLVMPLRELRAGGAGAGSGVRRLGNPAHELSVRETLRFASVSVESWMSAKRTAANPRPKGMRGVAGDIFSATLRAVEETARVYYLERMLAAARGVGLKTKS